MGIVFLNKWDGDKFQNGFACDYCGVENTINLICGLSLCATCLNNAIQEINAAILEAATNPEKARLIEAQCQ